MRKTIFLFACILLCLFSNATTKTVQSNDPGGWGNDANWSPNGVPKSGDDVIIPAGKTITVKGGFYGTAANIQIYIHGTLDFDPSGRLNLGNSSVVQLFSSSSSITSSGTSSEQIVIGGGIKYNGANDKTVTGPAFTTYSSPNSTPGTEKSGFTFGVLPIKLSSFTAQESKAGIDLKWVTVLEENLKSIELQRSTNGRDWKTIAHLQPKNVCTCATTYQHQDPSPEMGSNYYRLRSIHWDGHSEYSAVVVSKAEALQSKDVSWRIDHSRSSLFVSLNSTGLQLPVQLQLLSLNGQVLLKKNLVTTFNQLDISTLTNGLSILYLQDQKGKKIAIKMVR